MLVLLGRPAPVPAVQVDVVAQVAALVYNHRMNRRGWNLRGSNKPIIRGPARSTWKGDLAATGTKRQRAQRRYRLRACDRCGRPGMDRHHRDGNTGNNEPENIEILCRRCHMEIDGRLDRFKATSASLRGPQPRKRCSNCERLSKPLRRGRCHACNEYLRRQGSERPYVIDGRSERLV